MKLSFQVEAEELTREEPPKREQIPDQAFGARVEIGKVLNQGIFVRSVCLHIFNLWVDLPLDDVVTMSTYRRDPWRVLSTASIGYLQLVHA